jgi:hypothetical protein
VSKLLRKVNKLFLRVAICGWISMVGSLAAMIVLWTTGRDPSAAYTVFGVFMLCSFAVVIVGLIVSTVAICWD